MKVPEKIALVVVLAAITASSVLYGVWEDKVTLFAPLVVLIYIALAIWAISEVRVQASGFRFQASGFKMPPGGMPLLLFWLYSALMIPFSVIPYEAKISTLRFGCYLGTYWAVATILSRFPRRKGVLMTLFVMLVLVALYSLVQHKIAPNMIYGVERYADYRDRLAGTYQCPNHIAHLFQMWIPFCLVFLFLPQFGWFWRICFGYALPLFFILIYQTQSRAGLLGTVAALSTTALLAILRKSRRFFYIALLVVPLLGAGTVGGLWLGSSMFRERMQPVVDVASIFFAGNVEEAISVDFRPQTWVDSLTMVKDRPLAGVGPGNYELTFPEYRQRVFFNRILTGHPHNEPIEFLTEYGLIGAGLLIWALAGVCVSLVRLIKTAKQPYHALPAVALLAALAGTFVHGLFDFELRIFPNALMLSLLAGCAVAPLLQQRGGRKESGTIQLPPNKSVTEELGAANSKLPTNNSNGYESRDPSIPDNSCGFVGKKQSSVRLYSPQSVFCLLFSVLMLLTALWSVQVMSSAWIRAWGDRAKAVEDRISAEKLYKTSAAIDPQNWAAHLGLGQVIHHAQYYEIDPALKKELAEQEREAYLKAYRHNVKKEEVVYGLGRAELALGNRKDGIETLRKAAHYKRFNDLYWRKLGIELRKEGLYEEALETFLYAQKLDRGNKTVKRNIEWLKERL